MKTRKRKVTERRVKRRYIGKVSVETCSKTQFYLGNLSFEERFAYFRNPSPLSSLMSFRYCDGVLDKIRDFSAEEKMNTLSFLSCLRLFMNYQGKVGKREGGFININKDFLRSRIMVAGANYAIVIRKMLDRGLIERDNHFITGKKSFGYRLAQPLAKGSWKTAIFSDFVRYNIQNRKYSDDSQLGKTYLEVWTKLTSSLSNWRSMQPGKLRDICKYMCELGAELTIVEGNHDAIILKGAKETFQAYLEECKVKKVNPEWTESQVVTCFSDSLQAIKDGYFTVTCHDNRRPNYTNRIFSNVTNLKKDFRSLLRFRGQELVNIDIKSSQPALLASFYKDETPAEKEEREKYLSIIASETEDIYIELANDPANRGQAKTDMFTIMFGKIWNQRGEFFERFKQKFPFLIQRITENKKGNYKAVARGMQLKESSIMIEGVAHELLVERKIPCFTIHDSILCLEQDAEAVKECITRHFLAAMDFAPVLRIER